MAGAGAAQKNTKGSAAPKGEPPGDVTEKIAERNKESGGGKEPLKEPLGKSGAQEDAAPGEKESGPCGLPKNCSIL